MDAGNILKPKLARGELHIVGATTLDEYRKNIEKDPALERRFQPVQVGEPSIEDAIAILSGLRSRYEDHHKVHYTDEAITAAVELSARYIRRQVLAGQGNRPDRPGRRQASLEDGHGRHRCAAAASRAARERQGESRRRRVVREGVDPA